MPSSRHCKVVEPNFIEAAELLRKQGSRARLMKLDATVHTISAAKYNINSYPDFRLFISGEPYDYRAGREPAAIVNYVLKKSAPAAIPVNSREKILSEQRSSGGVLALGVFDDNESHEAQAFSEAAIITELGFAIVTGTDFDWLDLEVQKPAVVLLTDFEPEQIIYRGEFEPKAISNFVIANSMPLTLEFTQETSQKIFGGNIKSHFLLFLNKKSDEFEKVKSYLVSVAGEFREKFPGKLLFIYIDSEPYYNLRVLEFFGLRQDQTPAVRIINTADDMRKYAPKTPDISIDALRYFADEYVNGGLRASLLSQPVPENWDAAPVRILTGKNFDAVALAKDKDVLVEFHAPWCGHCQQLTPVYNELAKIFAEENHVLLTKIDSTVNEIENIKIESLPTLKLFKRESNDVITYDGDRSITALVAFLNKHTGSVVKSSGSNDEMISAEVDQVDASTILGKQHEEL